MIEQRQREPSQAETAAMIADALGETSAPVRESIESIVKARGRTKEKKLLNFALQAEEHGGLMTNDGPRRRTVGGIFFSYVYKLGVPKLGKSLPMPYNANEKAKKPVVQAETTQSTK